MTMAAVVMGRILENKNDTTWRLEEDTLKLRLRGKVAPDVNHGILIDFTVKGSITILRKPARDGSLNEDVKTVYIRHNSKPYGKLEQSIQVVLKEDETEGVAAFRVEGKQKPPAHGTFFGQDGYDNGEPPDHQKVFSFSLWWGTGKKIVFFFPVTASHLLSGLAFVSRDINDDEDVIIVDSEDEADDGNGSGNGDGESSTKTQSPIRHGCSASAPPSLIHPP